MSATGVREELGRALVDRAAPGGIVDEEHLALDANFAEFVRQEVKGRVPARAASYLRSPEVAGRWLSVLRRMAREVEGQLERRAREAGRSPSGRPSRYTSDADYARWRDSAEGYLGHVEGRIREAEDLLAARGAWSPPSVSTGGLLDLLTIVRRYLVDESDLPEPVRVPRRERAIRALSAAMGGSPQDHPAARAARKAQGS